MSTIKNTECTGDFFLLNQKPLPVGDFKPEYLTRGRSLYEVIRIIRRKPLFLSEHLDRLQQSSELSGLPLLLSMKSISAAMKRLAEINTRDSGNIKLVFRESGTRNDFIVFYDCHQYPTPEEYRSGISVGLYFAERPDPNVKMVNMELRTEARKQMQEGEYYEVILVNRDEDVTEGSRSNLFLISGAEVITPPLSEVLPGITRQKIIDICSFQSIPFRESKVSLNDLPLFESAFITGTSPKVLPVQSIGKQQFNVAHPLIQQISTAYDQLSEDDLDAFTGWD